MTKYYQPLNLMNKFKKILPAIFVFQLILLGSVFFGVGIKPVEALSCREVFYYANTYACHDGNVCTTPCRFESWSDRDNNCCSGANFYCSRLECPTNCHSDSGYCGNNWCSSNAPAAQSCPTSCHTDTQYVSNGSCGQTACGSNAPAAQACPTSCHTNTVYVSNGSCGQTACPPNAGAAQSCPTTCHTDTQYVSNGACGTTTCPPNAGAAQTCPTTCHTNTQYVSNGSCGTTTCAPNAPAAQSCSSCHTNTYTVPDGNCGTITCPPNATGPGSCPTTCHANVITVSDGACGLTTCAPNAPAAGTCASCHTNTYTVPDGNCGSITCLPNAPAAGTCPLTCGYLGGTVPDGNCGTITCPSFASIGCYFSRSNAQSSNGVVSTGRILGFDGNIPTKMSVPQWQVADGSENLTQPVYDYNYFYQKLGSPTTVNFTGKLNEIVGTATIYYAGTTVNVGNLQGNWSNYNQNAIIFVNGDLNINTQVLVPAGKFLAFIVFGNITIAPTIGTTAGSNVSTIEGVYLTNGAFATGIGNGVAHAKFVGRGMFIADANLDGTGGFSLQRTLGATDNAFYPAEYFEYRPDFLVNFPSQLGVRRISWKEVAP